MNGMSMAQAGQGMVVTMPQGEVIVVPESREPFMLLGQHPRATLCLKDPKLHRRHALFLFTTQGVFFNSLDQAGPFLLDGQPVQCGWLEPGNSLTIATYQIQFGEGGVQPG